MRFRALREKLYSTEMFLKRYRDLSRCVRLLSTHSSRPVPISSPVRVRFAPSPTGFLHLGGLRTALLNYLFARKYDGTFLFRLEDTDLSRKVEGSAEQLLDDITWAGLKTDGEPCVQSDRASRGVYLQHAQQLVSEGHAYHCFCTERRLDLIRKEALRLREVPRYDNHCRSIPNEEALSKIAHGEKHCIRLKLDGIRNCGWRDIIIGDIPMSNSPVEGDPVILKADGMPTYHLANVVDDHDAGVTHVLRGVEWLPSTPKHLLMYKQFGWSPPEFAHLPLLLNTDGTKISKRQGPSVTLCSLRQQYYPLALLNLVTSVGSGLLPLPRGSPPCIFTLEEMVERFDLSSVGANNVKIELHRLREFSNLELNRRLLDPVLQSGLVCDLETLVRKNLGSAVDSKSLHKDYLAQVLKWSKDRIHCLQDLVLPELTFLWAAPPPDMLRKTLTLEDAQIIERLAAAMAPEKEMKEVAKACGVKFKTAMKLVRIGLSGMESGPAVGEMTALLGLERTIERLRRTSTLITQS